MQATLRIGLMARLACRWKVGGMPAKSAAIGAAAVLRDVVVRFDGSSDNEIENSQIAKGKVEPMDDGASVGIRRRR